MTLSDFRRITDELLSAYIDDEVTEQERTLIEAAIAQDEEIAWRLNSLRQTVTLLHDLPELPLPRSFTLTFDHARLAQVDEQPAGVGATEPEIMATPAAPRLMPKSAPTPQAGFWEQVTAGWHRFWQGGNPLLRNAAAVSFALMLLLASGGQLINRAMQPLGTFATAPAAAPASQEAAPAAESVALAPPTMATEAASLQVEEGATNKAPGEDEDNARVMQAPATEATESTAAESAAAEATESDAAIHAGEAAIAEAAPASENAMTQAAPATESAPESAAAAMAAPEQPPLVASQPPFPGDPHGRGGGIGGGGGSDEPGMGGGNDAGGLVPEQAYEFEVDPLGPSDVAPAEEAVSASVAAEPVIEAPADSAADMASTPAVDAPVAAAASDSASEAAVSATPTATSDDGSDTAAARSAAPAEETASEEAMVAEPPAEATTETAVEPTAEPTIAPTPEAVALVAPGAITSSEVIEAVDADETVAVTSYGANLPVLWIAQGSTLLLTILFTSLWWRSRTPRRTRR